MARSKSETAVLMARVSSREQRDEGFSLPAQERLLQEYAKRQDLRVVKVFLIAETASKPVQRRLFGTMMEFIRERGVTSLVVEKVDRLVRSFKDTVLIDDWLEADEARRLHCVKDSLVLHKHSRSQEKLNWGVRVVLAKNMIDNLKEEVAKGVQEKLEAGALPGKPPIGYVAVGEIGRKRLVPNDVMAPLVRRLFSSYLDPMHSLSSVTAELNSAGLRTRTGRPVARSYVRLMLSNSIYTGQLPWAGKIYTGEHEAIVTESAFQAVQAKLTGKRAPRYRKHDSLFRGLIVCTYCSATISWELQKGRYYGSCKSRRPCNNRQYAREDRLESQLVEGLDGVLSPWPELVESVIAYARREATTGAEATAELHRSLDARLHDLDRRLGLAYEDRLDGRISANRYDTMVKQVADEQALIREKLSLSNDEWRQRELRAVDILELCQQAADLYTGGDVTGKRALLKEIYSNLQLADGTLAYQYTKSALELRCVLDDDDLQRPLGHDRLEPCPGGSVEPRRALEDLTIIAWQRLKSVVRILGTPEMLHPTNNDPQGRSHAGST